MRALLATGLLVTFVTHNLRTAVVGPDGRLFRLYRGNDWTPAALRADLQAAAAP